MSEQTEGAEPRRPTLRTGSETPGDAEDLTMAHGEDPTPENIERNQRIIDKLGWREAVDRTTP
ncbi:MAG: hypothetical protein ACJ72W_25770 [Actinoallomurus sp.]